MSAVWYILAGLAAGVISGMGMGGGTLLIPILTLLLGVSQHSAQGVNMLAFLPGAILAIFIHRKNGRICFKAALPLLISGAIGAVGGALLAACLTGDWLRRGFGAFLVVLAFVQWRSGEKRNRK